MKLDETGDWNCHEFEIMEEAKTQYRNKDSTYTVIVYKKIYYSSIN